MPTTAELDRERVLLVALIFDPSHVPLLARELHAEDFHEPAHACV